MQKILLSLICLTVSSVICPVAYSSDVDAKQFLNKALSEKPKVARQRIQTNTHEVCPHQPPVKDGGGYIDCYTKTENIVIHFVDFARVTTTEVKEVRDWKLGTDKAVELPKTPLLFRQIYKNCADATTIN